MLAAVRIAAEVRYFVAPDIRREAPYEKVEVSHSTYLRCF